jgi:hypothetical protein
MFVETSALYKTATGRATTSTATRATMTGISSVTATETSKAVVRKNPQIPVGFRKNGCFPEKPHMAMDQYLLIPFLVG